MGVALVAGCYNNNNPGQLICQANRIIQQRPDSALILLKQIDSSGRWNRRLRAEYSLAYVTALDKNYIDTTNVSLLNPAIDYYERRGTAEDKMKVYYYLGCLQSNEGDFTSACASFNRAWREARMTDDPLAKGMIMAALGIAYNANMIAEEELYCFQQAYSCSSYMSR